MNGEVGDYVTIARQERETDNWFIGSITDENSRMIQIDLDFLDAGKDYKAIIYRDADDAHWDRNPTALIIETNIVNDKSTLEIQLAPGGGAAISLQENN